MAIQVLIASDQLVLRKGLSTLLKSAGVDVVGESVDGPGIMRLARTCCPDVIVLNPCGPSLNDLAIVRRILQVSVATKIILWTARGEEQDVLPALQAGVSGFVLKTDAADLPQAIQEVSRGMIFLSRNVSSDSVKAYLTRAGAATGRPCDAGRPGQPSRDEAGVPVATIPVPGTAVGQRRLTAIMFTDMVGYSALTRKSESLALELVERHNGLLRQCFVEHGGREIKAMGDGFMVVFASALDAVRCAVAIQSAVHEHSAVAPPEQGFLVRIGVHVGDVVHQGDDIFGDGVNIASRIECLAKPGGICVSEQVVNLIRHTIGRPLIKLGKAALKNIPTPVRVYCVGLPWEERPVLWRDRMSFACFQKRAALSLADLTNAAFLAAVSGLVIWQSVAEHKSIHAMVWFGNGASAETRPADPPRIAAIALAETASGRTAAPQTQAVTGAALSAERRVAEKDHGTGPSQVTPPTDLLSLMVKRDSGETFHFARHYDRIRTHLQKSSGDAAPPSPDTVWSARASLQQTLFEEVFAWTVQPGSTAVRGGTL